MGFSGFPVEAVEFFEGLEADNSKSYWQAHKAIYDAAVKAPMEALVNELGGGKIFRPNRDIRFSADKSPYKTNIAATLANGGYVSLSADAFGVGTGMYVMAPDQLERYRQAVDAEASGAALGKLVAAVRKKGIEVNAHDALKSAPKGYAKDHPRIELLRLKGLITWREWPVDAWLGTKEPKARVVKFLRDSTPISAWLDDHVGPSTMPGYF
jgi:uncharacterized protein (TIGR02453 family)